MKTVVETEGWKKAGTFEVEKKDRETFLLREYRQTKEGGLDIIENDVPYDNVWNLFTILQNNCEPGREYSYTYVVKKLIEFYGTPEGFTPETFIACFNGGRYRKSHYFPTYYYPLKVLERQGWITYYGRGGIMLHPTSSLFPSTKDDYLVTARHG